MPVSLRTTIASIELENCIYNASGPRTGSLAAMSKIAESASGAVLAKSATLNSQTGNPLPRSWHSPEDSIKASLNSEGLPNSGIEYYINETTIAKTMGDIEKPYMVSISGKTLEDNIVMLTQIFEQKQKGAKIAAVELNLACPNIIGKPIIGFDFPQMEQVLEVVSKLYKEQKGKTVPLGVKMPPYFDTPHFETAASILNKYKHCVKYVASINTVGNALAVDFHAEMPVIASKGGFAGLSGPAIKYTALANVQKMRQYLDPSIDVVGVGGVSSGKDAFEMILVGASAVQVGTCHWIEGPKCFERISKELKEIMEKKQYSSIEDFRGKLKEWNKEGAQISRAARAEEKAKATSTPMNTSGDSATIEKRMSRRNKRAHLTNFLLLTVVALLFNEKYQAFKTPDDDDFYFNVSVALICVVILLLRP